MMKGNKTWQRNLLNSAVAASMLFGASMAGAATNGSIGATSEGTVDLTILVPDLVLVTGLDDVQFIHDQTNGASALETFCVWSTPGIGYDVTIDSLSPTADTEFQAFSGTEFIPYAVDFDDSSTGVNALSVTEGATLNRLGNPFVSATDASPGCSGGDNASIRISTEATGAGNPVAGIYEDTLTLIVAPMDFLTP